MQDELTEKILGAAMKVHSVLGPGLLESAYEKCLLFELHRIGLKALYQVELPIVYENLRIDAGYRIDLLIEDRVIVELKAVEKIVPIHKAQLLSYLKLSKIRVGLLLNFNVLHLKDGITRVVND
jgi:GxxExxY protein